MIGRTLDRLLGVFSPRWELERTAARATLQQINQLSGSGGGYDGGKFNRLTKGHIVGSMSENGVPQGQIARLRWSSWDLFRNNPHARKIVRTLEAKVIGKGPRPNSAARRLDGSPHVAFRQKAQQLWEDVSQELDYRGRPGRGGQSITGLGKSALRATILGGEVLFRFRNLTIEAQMRKRLRLPLQVQLIHPERIDENCSLPGATTDRVYRGIEVDGDGIPVAYWIREAHPSDPLYVGTASTQVSAKELGHVFAADDIDQIRGTPWFAPALMQMRDTADYQFNELKASAIASCVAMGVRRPKGVGVGKFGAQIPTTQDLTDADGNRITAMQPGMILDLGSDGEIQSFNPARPTTNAEAWIQHMIRSTASAMPGIKASTLTGDYRNSSFSSERSAENDAWPEIEGIQQWFYEAFYQQIYEAVIIAGVEAGYFGDVIKIDEFNAHRAELLCADWQGPIALSINPVDDIKAAKERIAAGLSTVQIEAAKLGNNWREILRQFKEFSDEATTLKLLQNLLEQWLGLDPQVNAADDGTSAQGVADVPAQAA